jgi:RND family efflux transporter MFP subunit
MNNPQSQLAQLTLDPAAKRRRSGLLTLIFAGVVLLLLAAVLVWQPWAGEGQRVFTGAKRTEVRRTADSAGTVAGGATLAAAGATNGAPTLAVSSDRVLEVSGYIVARERIEISPRFMGVVQWIGVKKGDAVTNGQVVVRLDDTEFRARLQEAEGTLAMARATLAKAELDLERISQLARTDIESRQALDDARLRVDSARAQITAAEGGRDVARAYVNWCIIRSPIDGVVLEKLVDPNELVTPQSFGGTRGPSTALLAVADLRDLQVEIDLNEADLARVSLNQPCRVRPEAYPDKVFRGFVAEIAPEANRAKGTLQIKVQVENPDRFLTPELSARVEFLRP